MFENILTREAVEDQRIAESISLLETELTYFQATTRSLRSELIAPGTNPSASFIEERIISERKAHELSQVQENFDDALLEFGRLQIQYTDLLAEQGRINKDKLSKSDRDKLKDLTEILQKYSGKFGFTTFSPSEISLPEDSYKPEKEGYEIGFETSASDAIRLKWAYQLSLLELAKRYRTNHPGILIFDEPRQQSSSKVSFKSLLAGAALAKDRKQQVIFLTSEEREGLTRMTNSIDCREIMFPGYVLQKLS